MEVISTKIRVVKRLIRKNSFKRTRLLARLERLRLKLKVRREKLKQKQREMRNLKRRQLRASGRAAIPEPELPIVSNQLGDPRYSTGESRCWDTVLGDWVPDSDFPFISSELAMEFAREMSPMETALVDNNTSQPETEDVRLKSEEGERIKKEEERLVNAFTFYKKHNMLPPGLDDIMEVDEIKSFIRNILRRENREYYEDTLNYDQRNREAAVRNFIQNEREFARAMQEDRADPIDPSLWCDGY